MVRVPIVFWAGGGRRQSTYNVPQNPQQANGAKDALSREIYSRLFDWIVARINLALQRYGIKHKTVIGILDIFGFGNSGKNLTYCSEIFNQNGFEQFCINYVNEKLQQYFIELTLKGEKKKQRGF